MTQSNISLIELNIKSFCYNISNMIPNEKAKRELLIMLDDEHKKANKLIASYIKINNIQPCSNKTIKPNGLYYIPEIKRAIHGHSISNIS